MPYKERIWRMLSSLVLLSLLTGCSNTPLSFLTVPPWHFSQNDNRSYSNEPIAQDILDIANRDFGTIMPAYETGIYPSEFDSRFGKGPYTDEGNDNNWFQHGFSIRSYFNSEVRFSERCEQFQILKAEHARAPWYYPDPLSPTDDWKEGYFTIYLAGALQKEQKRYGFTWHNDFSSPSRDVSVTTGQIRFNFHWKRYAIVPEDVSLTQRLEEQGIVALIYKSQMIDSGVFSNYWDSVPLIGQ